MYNHIEDKEKVLKHLKLFDSLDTQAMAKAYLGQVYYRTCIALPKFLTYYSSTQVQNQKIDQYIKTKNRCLGCVDLMIKYFNKYEKYCKESA